MLLLRRLMLGAAFVGAMGLAAGGAMAGPKVVEGPGYDEGPGYYAVFFEDPSGNRLEICHRDEGSA